MILWADCEYLCHPVMKHRSYRQLCHAIDHIEGTEETSRFFQETGHLECLSDEDLKKELKEMDARVLSCFKSKDGGQVPVCEKHECKSQWMRGRQSLLQCEERPDIRDHLFFICTHPDFCKFIVNAERGVSNSVDCLAFHAIFEEKIKAMEKVWKCRIQCIKCCMHCFVPKTRGSWS